MLFFVLFFIISLEINIIPDPQLALNNYLLYRWTDKQIDRQKHGVNELGDGNREEREGGRKTMNISETR